ncbi:MAG: CHAT domain-containing protein, partial [Pyrinomonadaceae bacterium]
LKDLIVAYDIASAAKSNRKLRIAATAMRFRSDQSEGRDFIQKCLHVLLATLGDKERRSYPSLILTIVILIAERYLEEGTAVDFLSLLQPEFEWLEGWDMNFPWQYEYVRGWLAYQLGDSRIAWSRLERAANKIDEKVPQGEDVSFSPTWMYDKDRFQQHLSTVAIELVRRDDLSRTELLKVYELTNGREIAARLGMHLSSEDITSGLIKLAEKANRDIQVFFPLIEGKNMHLCHLSSTSRVPVIIEEGQWDRDELLKVRKQTYNALKQANPEDLSVLDAKIRPWAELSASIGKAMAPYLDESGHVCFLPGRDLTGLPLHLVQLSGGINLLERTTVTYAPNFAMLFAPQSLPSPSSVAVVTVSKRRDSDKFRGRALETSRELIDLWRRNCEVHELTELEATAGATLDVIQRVDEVIFICHGAYAGPGRGYGICVSDEHQLPPSLFPIVEVPDLERFVLTWDDFEEVDSCPHTVVSIACSSGLTEVVAGGTRHGLEQTLFGHGTRALISPLWDIDQESGLEWLKTFCQARSQNPERAIEETYRETSLALKARFSHPYFWGSFTLNGSLF